MKKEMNLRPIDGLVLSWPMGLIFGAIAEWRDMPLREFQNFGAAGMVFGAVLGYFIIRAWQKRRK